MARKKKKRKKRVWTMKGRRRGTRDRQCHQRRRTTKRRRTTTGVQARGTPQPLPLHWMTPLWPPPLLKQRMQTTRTKWKTTSEGEVGC
jgi:hypothetical protein